MTKQPDHKIRVGVFFGGKSAEHEVSVQSVKNVVEAIDKTKFTPILIGIDRSGRWHTVDSDFLLNKTEVDQLTYDDFVLVPGESDQPIDVALPILHGPHGEDGTIQGLFELAGVPYVGCGVSASAVGMDKDITKRLLHEADIPIARYKVFYTHQADSIDPAAILEEFGSPVFVKPANMGSSVGVSRAQTPDELSVAIKAAFAYDSKLLIEQAIYGDEIECSVLGNESPKVSVVGRIIPRAGDFYSYDAKYIDENGAILEIPAKLSLLISKQAQQLALRTYKTLYCEGLARVDMFVTKDHKIVVNEINTMPGFTKISMYPKLWEASGLAYTDLITQLIELAIERHQKKRQLKHST